MCPLGVRIALDTYKQLILPWRQGVLHLQSIGKCTKAIESLQFYVFEKISQRCHFVCLYIFCYNIHAIGRSICSDIIYPVVETEFNVSTVQKFKRVGFLCAKLVYLFVTWKLVGSPYACNYSVGGGEIVCSRIHQCDVIETVTTAIPSPVDIEEAFFVITSDNEGMSTELLV